MSLKAHFFFVNSSAKVKVRKSNKAAAERFKMNATKEELCELWSKHKPLWTSWARKLKYVDYEVEDLYQESYLILVKAVEQYDPRQGVPFEAYYKILLYRWGQRYLYKRRERPIGDETIGEYLNLDTSWSDLGEKVWHTQQIQKLGEAMTVLKPMEKAILIKFYFEGKKLKEIGSELGLTLKTVATRKEKAIKKIYNFFEEN